MPGMFGRIIKAVTSTIQSVRSSSFQMRFADCGDSPALLDDWHPDHGRESMEKAYREIVMRQITDALSDNDWHGVSILASGLLSKIELLEQKNDRLEQIVQLYDQAEVAKW
jgi:hypothetical protein